MQNQLTVDPELSEPEQLYGFIAPQFIFQLFIL